VHPLRRPDPRPPGRTDPRRAPRRLLRRQLVPGRGQQGHLGARPARAMILSRVGDALYWMARYLERAENVTRLLLVTGDVATEFVGLDADLARAEWNDLRVIFPGAEGTGEPPRRINALAQLALFELSIDPRHPYSIFFSLKKARDNARTVREALT